MDSAQWDEVNINPLCEVCAPPVKNPEEDDNAAPFASLSLEMEDDHRTEGVAYWKPDDTLRSVVNAALFLGAWASGYTAAQIYYTALTVKFGYGYFVTVGGMGQSSVVGADVQLKVFLLSLGFNVAFGFGAWALVHVQVAAGRRTAVVKQLVSKEVHSVAEGISVFCTKLIDSVIDGATFFSTIILFSILASAFGGDDSPQGRALLLPELFALGIAITLGSVGWVMGFEALPYWYYDKIGRGAPPEDALKTNRQVSDWYIGQCQWLMGFAWWSTALVLLTDSYLGLYGQVWAWWSLTMFILLCYIFFALGYCKCSCLKGEWWDSGNIFFQERPRIGAMLAKSVSWVFGIGCYFSMKRTSTTFLNALNLEVVNRTDLASFSIFGVTFISFTLLLLLELAERRVERLTGAFDAHGSLPPKRTAADERFLKVVDVNKAMFRLSVCYVTGKAWESLAFGFDDSMSAQTERFAVIATEWQMIAGGFALLHTAWELKTQRRHGSAHSSRCCCTATGCAPVYYRVSDASDSPDV